MVQITGSGQLFVGEVQGLGSYVVLRSVLLGGYWFERHRLVDPVLNVTDGLVEALQRHPGERDEVPASNASAVNLGIVPFDVEEGAGVAVK